MFWKDDYDRAKFVPDGAWIESHQETHSCGADGGWLGDPCNCPHDEWRNVKRESNIQPQSQPSVLHLSEVPTNLGSDDG